MDLLDGLPERGWGVLRCPLAAILVLDGAGLVKVQVVLGRPGVYQVRLTGAGRQYRRSGPRGGPLRSPGDG